MTEREAVAQLEFDKAMITFDPTTGEELTLELVKLRNEDNYKTYLADELAIKAFEELRQYRTIGTIEEFKKSVNVRKQITEIVDRQLIAGKNNYKEIYGCFWEIAKVIQDNY